MLDNPEALGHAKNAQQEAHAAVQRAKLTVKSGEGVEKKAGKFTKDAADSVKKANLDLYDVRNKHEAATRLVGKMQSVETLRREAEDAIKSKPERAKNKLNDALNQMTDMLGGKYGRICADILQNRADAKCECKLPQDASEDIKESLKLNPHAPKPYFLRAKIQSQDRNYREAIKNLERSKELAEINGDSKLLEKTNKALEDAEAKLKKPEKGNGASGKAVRS
ncbi:hypothetical protein WOLCODRAFT_157728 [Wolfiporia cocos MD-104 SS10]|uniref:Uncharacterized protein n=1 Tax=Wolfiporia cocos (strain MD-104) TaxID=742152 RepID=A0A2H3J4A7_WOLCO|nr:hypothetical protein WOLCODRAFT_157728 [Wolfiporia cocos MD-104 SS10]